MSIDPDENNGLGDFKLSYYFNKLALFDVDKTLIRVSKGHSTAFSIAFKIVYGIDAKIDEIDHHGMTDQQVIIEVLKIMAWKNKQ